MENKEVMPSLRQKLKSLASDSNELCTPKIKRTTKGGDATTERRTRNTVIYHDNSNLTPIIKRHKEIKVIEKNKNTSKLDYITIEPSESKANNSEITTLRYPEAKV